MEFEFPATIPMWQEEHGGHDVGVWAAGPMGGLFHAVHEQSYVGHVVGFALCQGIYERDCQRGVTSGSASVVSVAGSVLIMILGALIKLVL